MRKAFLFLILFASALPFQDKIAAYLLDSSSVFFPKSEHLIRVEIEVNNSQENTDTPVVEVIFNNKKINLVTADPQGRKGSYFFQVPPGKYTLEWKVKNNEYSWPKFSSYKKFIDIAEEKQWVYIQIQGRQVLVN